MTLCSSPGIPRLMLSPKRFKIFERSGKVLFLFEWNRLFRQIDMRDDATIENSKALDGTHNMAFDLYGLEDTVGAQVGHARGRLPAIRPPRISTAKVGCRAPSHQNRHTSTNKDSLVLQGTDLLSLRAEHSQNPRSMRNLDSGALQ